MVRPLSIVDVEFKGSTCSLYYHFFFSEDENCSPDMPVYNDIVKDKPVQKSGQSTAWLKKLFLDSPYLRSIFESDYV